MNLFDLIPGNDPISKGINAWTIWTAVVLCPIVGVPVVAVGVAVIVGYSLLTGLPIWTYKP